MPPRSSRILAALEKIQRRIPIVFPTHPRTRQRIAALGLEPRFAVAPNLRMVDPQGYIDFLALMSNARLMLSDSGGIQEETCILGVPCVVLRENTERPVTLRSGYHALAGTDTQQIVSHAEKYLAAPPPTPCEIELWDGHAAERIVALILEQMQNVPATK